MIPENAAKPAVEYDPYPCGTDSPRYRITFQAWMALFLLTICAGLVNFLLTWFTRLTS